MESGNYTSSLMFGVQWDLMLEYLEAKGIGQSYLKADSMVLGNYYNNAWNIENEESKYMIYGAEWKLGSCGEKESIMLPVLLSTGASEEFSKQGIYDFAGNVYEWTLDYTSLSSIPCVRRGGDYTNNGSSGPAVIRYGDTTTNFSDRIGFRVSIY